MTFFMSTREKRRRYFNARRAVVTRKSRFSEGAEELLQERAALVVIKIVCEDRAKNAALRIAEIDEQLNKIEGEKHEKI
jgi:hypothetical protein